MSSLDGGDSPMIGSIIYDAMTIIQSQLRSSAGVEIANLTEIDV